MTTKTMTTIDPKTVRSLHKTGIKGILDILIKHKTFKKWPFYASLLLAFILCICFLTKEVDLLKILSETSSIVQTVFPGLLGFSLGGYAIAVGFSNTDLIKRATKKDKHNIYQILSGIFALSILIQVLATVVGLAVYWFIKADVSGSIPFQVPKVVAVLTNSILLFVLLFSSLYSMILIPYVVTNLFTLSQLNSLYYTLEKSKEEIAGGERGK